MFAEKRLGKREKIIITRMFCAHNHGYVDFIHFCTPLKPRSYKVQRHVNRDSRSRKRTIMHVWKYDNVKIQV